MAAGSPRSRSLSLERRLGPLDAAAIVVSNVIGGGISSCRRCRGGGAGPGAFLGVLAPRRGPVFAGAMAYAELAALRRAPAANTCIFAKPSAPCGVSHRMDVICRRLLRRDRRQLGGAREVRGRFLPVRRHRSGAAVTSAPPGARSRSPADDAAIVADWLIALIHVRGLGPGRSSQRTGQLKILALSCSSCSASRSGPARWRTLRRRPNAAVGSWLLALIPVMFAYSGWNAASYLAEEMRSRAQRADRPRAGHGRRGRDLPRLNVLFLYVLPAGELAG